ncbi:redox-active disulfide protein 2 [Thiocapsa imhoffii]|uniref:Redox-active disulfide protein 2 n=1 Tax=Thiocapsa imhoffii TaxID=382777 RepID=A0A9X0WGT0_9GAMM|nr:redox-active disulfide protein 2 [Thiocapsa imhoffii]
MTLQILGSGCAKCATLALNTETAAQSLGLDFKLEKVTDLNAIIDAGVMSTPALAIDGEVKSMGKVLSVEQIKRLLET